jgi:predicted dehydrogenase
MTIRCLVIGVGKMGLAHLQALRSIVPDGLAAWAPTDRRRDEIESIGFVMLRGSLNEVLISYAPTHVVIASPVETLAETALQVMNVGVPNLLIEKPAFLNVTEAEALKTTAQKFGARVYVAYNRRFYGSVRTALSMISANEEKIESVLFEFNEVFPTEEGPRSFHPSVQQRWLLANSMHVIDAALFPVGTPNYANSHLCRYAPMPWHPAGGIFVGSGETDRGIPFAYHANWHGPGRWGFEWITRSRRYVFRPLEKLCILNRGTFELEAVVSSDDFDQRYKPGVFLQGRGFLSEEQERRLVSLDEAILIYRCAVAIGGYPND